MLPWLEKNSFNFPPLERALRKPNGLLALGGDLSSQRLIAAYRHGCFPWFGEDEVIMWWSPDPRYVLLPEQLHVPRSLHKSMRKNHFRITYDQAFAQVIQACAAPRASQSGTWICQSMQQAYIQLHQQGIAHSVEVWQDRQLVGGLYGIAMGQLFFGESMFSLVADASKTGFVQLVQDLQQAGFVLIDCQMQTEHLARFGAHDISRKEFAGYLRRHLDLPNQMHWQSHA